MLGLATPAWQIGWTFPLCCVIVDTARRQPQWRPFNHHSPISYLMAIASHLAITSLRKTILYLAALAVLGASPTWWACSSPTDLEQPRIPEQEPTLPVVGAWKYVEDNFTAGLADRATICQVVEEELDPGDVARNVDVLLWQSDFHGLRYPAISFHVDGTFATSNRITRRFPSDDGRIHNNNVEQAWTGTWLHNGALLVLFTDEPPPSKPQRITVGFKVIEDRLELSIPVTDFIQHLKPTGYTSSADPTRVFERDEREFGVSEECIATALAGIERVIFSYRQS